MEPIPQEARGTLASDSRVERVLLAAPRGFCAGVEMAIKAGATPNKIVFDSPVKRRSEIEKCNNELHGIILNVNSLEEVREYINLQESSKESRTKIY